MGWKNEKGEHMEWSAENTKAFIDVLYDRVKKTQLQVSTFKIEIWEDINNELKHIIGQNFGVDRLKKKFDRLCEKCRNFSTGHLWDEKYNLRTGEVYTRHVFQHDPKMLSEIFNEHTATRKLDQVSSQDPPTSDKEREIEGAHLSKGVHTDPDAIDDVGDGMQNFDKKRKTIGSSSEPQCEEAKKSKLEKLEPTSSQQAESTSVKTDASKAKADQYTTQASRATSSVTDPYSLDACMELLDSLEDIPSKIYNNALVKFLDKDWRHMFVKMPSFRRNDWLASLV